MTAPDLPWRGPGPGRPKLQLPPDAMPLARAGRLRKRWRYVAGFSEGLMVCAARVWIGPVGQTFWAVWERQPGRITERTLPLLRGGGGQVRFEDNSVRITSRRVQARLDLGEGRSIETVCDAGRGAYTWTRKLAGMTVRGDARIEGRPYRFDGRGVDDASAGYHRRHTAWRWSAGVGRTADGRDAAWNLVTGINDPPRHSERAIWLDGVPHEPDPVSFEGLDAVEFASGGRLKFSAEAARSRSDDLLVFRSRYTAPFGRFSGMLDDVALDHGLGVMESHAATW